MSKSLMVERRFAPLFWCQFCSALNDNFLKNALGMLVLFGLGGILAPQEPATASLLITLSGVVFISPFFFLSALGGELADKYDKALMAERVKLAELPVAALAATGFYLHSIPILFVALFGFGVIGALFGPVKYGILPEKLETSELSAGNALVEGATFLAILLGTIGGAVAVTQTGSAEVIFSIIVVLAVACWLFARAIPRHGPAAPDLILTRNPFASTAALLRELKSDPRIRAGAHVTSWFWLVGVLVLSLLPGMVKTVIGGSEHVYTASLTTFVIGIAIGSALAAGASHGKPNLALVPLGALGMALSAGALAAIAYLTVPPSETLGLLQIGTSWRGAALVAALLGLSICGGLYIVPSFAAVQSWAPPDSRARVIASVNVLNAAYMTAGGGVLAALQAAGLTLWMLFALLTIASVIVFALVCRSWGKEGVRAVGRGTFRLIYGLKVEGLHNLPPTGQRVVIAPNHVSLLDAAILNCILPEHAEFAVNTEISEVRWIKPFLRFATCHVIDPRRPLGTRGLLNAVRAGHSIVIFPEGRVSTTGSLMKVYDGTGMIADKADAWIVPVRIRGAERARVWSYLRASHIRLAWRPRITVTILPPVKLAIAPALKGRARRQSAARALHDVMVDTAVRTTPIERTVFEAVCEGSRNLCPAKIAVRDAQGTQLSSRKLILAAQALGGRLEEITTTGEAVGVMLPTSAGAAVVILALSGLGRVPAMLNFTAGAASIKTACTAAEVRTILTSRAFVEKARLQGLVREIEEIASVVFLEDIRASIGISDRIAAVLRGRRPLVARRADDPAVILFTSGSEGVPKGVVLSHRNILANVAQCLSRVDANGEDKVFNALPVFHAFGLTAGMIMPLVGGIPVFMYPTPLHYRLIPELVYDVEATILFGTDTFLSGYARVAHPYDFHCVRFIVSGAEALKQRTRQIYAERYGVRILEGYGVTEAAPVLAMNSPLASKPGSVGRLSPLVEHRLERVEGMAEHDGDLTIGRLHVRGPNIMLGYLSADAPGVIEAPPAGWHDTGDVVAVDTEGFVSIIGRARRFAKVGGEMVPLAVAERLAADLWPAAISVAVARPDARKGERIVLLTTEPRANRARLIAAARAAGVGELAVPADVSHVERLPLLGSGKPDYPAADRLAEELERRSAGVGTAAAANAAG